MVSNKDNKKLILIQPEETSKYFSACYLALKDFLKFIRTYPDIMYKILKLGNQKYLTKDFNYFILNNFYEDILNPNAIANEILYVIEHLFKDIVGQCENPFDFKKNYNESNLSIILESLIYIKDVKIYFNSIFGNIINKYVISGKSSKVLFFEIKELNTFINNREKSYARLYRNSDIYQKKELEKIQDLFSKNLNNIFKMRLNSFENMSYESFTYSEENMELMQSSEQNEEFASKYLLELNKNELKKIIQNNKDNKNTKEYLQHHLNLINKKDDNFYSNKYMLERIQKSNESEKILFYYQRNFFIVIEIISEIIEQIISSINNMPIIIKSILKILAEILKTKFPHIKNIELYSNLSYILVGLIKNCFYNPNYNLLLSEVILGAKIKQNLNVIISIFSKLISFKFYTSENKSDYSPFNLYFIEKIPSIFLLYEKILDFNCHYISNSHRKKSKIFNFSNNEDNTNSISYNDKNLFHSISICYRVEDVTTLLNIVQQNKNVIIEEKTSLYPNDKFKIIFDKLKENKEIFKNVKEKEKQNSIINYFILFEIIYSNISKDFVNSKKYSPFFKLELLENKNNSKKVSNKNNLISCQNALSELLVNIPALETISIDDNNVNNLKLIINDLSSYIKNKFNIIEYFKENEDKIPPEWYINSFTEYLEKIDEKYKKKEYEKFFDKFEKSIKNEIGDYKFDILGKLNESINNISEKKNEYNYLQSIYNKINTNDKVKEIIKNEIIEVEIKIKYSENEKYIQLNTTQINEDNNNDVNNNINLDIGKKCYNIYEFIKNFPNLNEIQKDFNISIFKIEKEIKIDEFLNSYLNLISSTILIKYDEENKQKIMLIIQKYIFEKIYDKIFPSYIEEKDLSITSKLINLKQIKFESLNLNNFDYDSILPIINKLFNQLDEKRWSTDKLKIINQIFEIVFNIIKYVKGIEYSDDDLSNILIYFLIKTKPENLNSNIEFLEIFGDKNEMFKNNINIKILKRCIENLLKFN